MDRHLGLPLRLLGLGRPEELRSWQRQNTTLLRAVQRHAGKPRIIDTSKYAGRALLLDRSLPGRVAVICVTRSGATLLEAFAKRNRGEQRPKRPLVGAAYYLATSTSLWLVSRRLSQPPLVLRFEDLMSDPVRALERIEAHCGLDLHLAKEAVQHAAPMAVGHILTGNRMRLQGPVTFEPGRGEDAGAGRRWIGRLLDRWREFLRL